MSSKEFFFFIELNRGYEMQISHTNLFHSSLRTKTFFTRASPTSGEMVISLHSRYQTTNHEIHWKRCKYTSNFTTKQESRPNIFFSFAFLFSPSFLAENRFFFSLKCQGFFNQKMLFTFLDGLRYSIDDFPLNFFLL